MISTGQSDFLNLVRWVAAWLVVVEHLRNLLFQDFGTLQSRTLSDYGFYFISGFGHEAVIVFFVISGFLVGGGALDRWSAGRFSWGSYLIDRISRLYAVYVLALLLGCVLDLIGWKWFDAAGYYSKSTLEPIATLNYDVSERLTLKHLLCSLFMLQEIVLPSFGSNGPLWSLAHEWWYYLIFPMIIQFFRGSFVARGFAVISICCLLFLLTPQIWILFGVWMLGVGAWKLNTRRLLPVYFALPLFLASLLFMRLEFNVYPYVSHFLIGISFTILLNSMCDRQFTFYGRNLSKFLADFSYSLYLIHFPVILFLVSILCTLGFFEHRLILNAYSFALFLSVMLLAVLLSVLISKVTEAKTPQLRVWMRGILD